VRLEPPADLREPRVPSLAVVGGGAHLDQLVGLEGAVDFRDHLVGEALVADEDHRAEFVGFGAQLAAAFRRKRRHRGSISK
jgi:hypothetical protein